MTTLQKPKPRILGRLDRARAKRTTWRDVCMAVKVRDGYRCRACRTRYADHVHHLVYRSHGGQDAATNCVALCTTCHQLVHAKVLQVAFDAERPAATVRFTHNRQWDRP